MRKARNGLAIKGRAGAFLRIAAVLLVAGLLSACAEVKETKDTLFQTSTINALLEGVYDGTLTYGELKKHGDTGIGTFDALDGEMIGFNGMFYEIKADGVAYAVDDSMKTPFAAVTFFEPDKSTAIGSLPDYKALEEYLDRQLPTKNIPYAIRIEGTFSYVKTRSVPAQKKPYPPLVEVVKNQPVFEFHTVRGTIVGFRLPEYMKGLNVPGYHLHFLTEDKKAGGHLLECSIRKARVEIDFLTKISLALPEQAEFYKIDLSKEKQGEVERVEK
ncbi:MAG: acetolactate decarboxylase [Nitrospirae bacterium]|nr:acetolactate decarboxylase [Nitrospirota bacterium]